MIKQPSIDYDIFAETDKLIAAAERLDAELAALQQETITYMLMTYINGDDEDRKAIVSDVGTILDFELGNE